jgi:hypothetical protein
LTGLIRPLALMTLIKNPTQERFRLAAYYPTDLAFEASGDEPLAWGSSWSGTPRCTPVDNLASRTTR